jgi:hypothetical protein
MLGYCHSSAMSRKKIALPFSFFFGPRFSKGWIMRFAARSGYMPTVTGRVLVLLFGIYGGAD